MKLPSLLALACLSIGATTASAHHSFAMYDNDHQILLSGTVTEFRWQNPHVYIDLQAPDAKGKPKVWLVECANPGILDRAGWKFNMIHKDDHITVVVAPIRTGEPGALLKQIKLADGRVFGNGGPAGPPSISIEDGKPLPAGAKP